MSDYQYEILRQLTTGGMAEVLLARRTPTEGEAELVVIKRVLPHLAQADGFLKMFAVEAKIASQLRHQNIVSVLEVGEMDALPFIAMERLDGADLLRLLQQCVLRKQALGTAVGMAVVAGAARGLGYAHRARSRDGRALRIVHRDVSPHNIFVTRGGVVKLLDFGIAKSAAQVGLTSTGQVKGKISYMSPEQIRAQPIDQRSDLWSLGVVLWEAVAGEKLFTRDNDAATLHAILHDPIPPLNRREVPGLDGLIARILTRDPAQRVATAEQIAEALDELLISMRVAQPQKLVAQRVASLVPAINPALDAARPSMHKVAEVVTFATGPSLAPARVSVAPPAPSPSLSPRHEPRTDTDPTLLEIPTPGDDEHTDETMNPDAMTTPFDRRMVFGHKPPPALQPVAPKSPPARAKTMAPSRISLAPPAPSSATAHDPPTTVMIAPDAVEEATAAVLAPAPSPVPPPATSSSPPGGRSSLPPPLSRPSMPPPPAATGSSPPARAAVSSTPPAPAAPPHAALADDPFGPPPPSPMPVLRGPSEPQLLIAPLRADPLAGFGVRGPDTLVAAELSPRGAPSQPARRSRIAVMLAAGALCFVAGVTAMGWSRIAPHAATAPSMQPMPIAAVASPAPVAPPAPVVAPSAEPVVVAAAPSVEAAPSVAASPSVEAAPSVAAAPSVEPSTPSVELTDVAVMPTPPPAPAASNTTPRAVAVAGDPTPPRAIAARTVPRASPGLVDLPQALAPRAVPTPVAAPTPVPTPVAAPAPGRNPNDPFESVYSDPAQRRRTQQQRARPVQAPPSTRGQQIFTEF